MNAKLTAILLVVLFLFSGCGEKAERNAEPELGKTAEEPVVLTVGTYGVSDVLGTAAAEFNRNASEYSVEIVDYSEYGEEVWMKQFQADLLSGQVDIVSFGNGGYCGYGGIDSDILSEAGMLTDLTTFLAEDPVLTENDLVPSLLAALKSDGRLYELPMKFSVKSAVASKASIGEMECWTFTEFLETAAALEDLEYPFGTSIQRQRLLQILLAFQGDSLVDWETGECWFRSENGLALLEFAVQCPLNETEEPEYPAFAVAAGRQLSSIVDVSLVCAIQEYQEIYGEYTFVGVPSDDGWGTAFQLQDSFGVAAASEQKQAAWEFLRQLYTEEYQSGHFAGGFSSNQAVLEQYLAAPEETDPVDMLMSWGERGVNLVEIPYHIPTAEEIAVVRSLIENTEKIYRPDLTIAEIVWEEIQPVLSGEKTVEDVAVLIQNRVEIYVSEQN